MVRRLFGASLAAALAATTALCAPAFATDISSDTSVATGGTASRTVADRDNDPGYSLLEKGALCDGATDDTNKINAALSSGNLLVTGPAGKKCYSATGVKMPADVTFRGGSFDPVAGTKGFELICAANVQCLTVEDGAHNSPARVENMVVATNNPGVPTSGSCIYVNGGQGVVLERVMTYNCYDGYYWKAGSTYGLRGKMLETYTGRIAHDHVVMDTYSNLRIAHSIFGTNGSNDLSANAFIGITGGVPGSAAGPNTLVSEDNHFNQGGNSAAYWLDFYSCATGCVGPVDAREWTFTDNHVENIGTAFIHSDSTWNEIDHLSMGANRFSQPSVPFWALDPATTLTTSLIERNFFATSSFALAPNAAMVADIINGNQFASPVSFTSNAPASSLTFGLDAVTGGSLSFAGPWKNLTFTAPDFGSGGGTLNNTATGTVNQIQ